MLIGKRGGKKNKWILASCGLLGLPPHQLHPHTLAEPEGWGCGWGGGGASRRNQQQNLRARLEPEDPEELSPSLAPGSEPQ